MGPIIICGQAFLVCGGHDDGMLIRELRRRLAASWRLDWLVNSIAGAGKARSMAKTSDLKDLELCLHQELAASKAFDWLGEGVLICM